MFPEVGHTMLPSDRDFAHIENNVRNRYQNIYNLDHWAQVVTKGSKQGKLQVVKMQPGDFLEFSALEDNVNKRKQYENGSAIKLQECCRLSFSKEEPCMDDENKQVLQLDNSTSLL